MRTMRGETWRLWGAVLVLLCASDSARAFYWYGWPGSQISREPTLLTPEPETPTPPQPGGPPVPVDKPPIGPPKHTPEPSTGVIGLIGLGALAARRWTKKR